MNCVLLVPVFLRNDGVFIPGRPGNGSLGMKTLIVQS